MVANLLFTGLLSACLAGLSWLFDSLGAKQGLALALTGALRFPEEQRKKVKDVKGPIPVLSACLAG
jgi:hypothetical protein